MAAESLLHTRSSLLMIVLVQYLFQTSVATPSPSCPPSSCGIIPNISFPFRLSHDPDHCGERRFELSCQNNLTSIHLNSHQYYVKAINYHYRFIRLVDASINNDDDACSFPNYSAYAYNTDSSYLYPSDANWPINLVSCPHPLKNSSSFTEITHCAASDSSNPRFTYIKIGHMNASEVAETCGLELIVMASRKKFKDLKNVSLSEIHQSLLYGFELYYSNYRSPFEKTKWGIIQRFIIFPFIVWLLIYKFRRRHLSIFHAIECFLQSDNNLTPIRYSYSHIKKMNKGFQYKLGEGGYGSVYKGRLRSGRDVAVKLLGKSGTNGKDFINEISTIGKIHHVNIVKLVGYCAEGSKRALVFDFMPNGSLEKYLFNPDKMNSLNWDTKFQIAVGVARGIAYLHRGCDIQILHFDIKPHNILLDEKFIPKISDFGMAKFCSANKNAVTMTAARGTIGYVAPELISRSIGVVSYKADVYSFGMVLIEIMTIVALWCIQMNPDDRPSMNKVLEMLEGEVENLRIPNYPSQSPHIVVNETGTSGRSSTESSSLLYYSDAPSIEITIEE
ncbi:hypothetical protein C2S51_032459 [Perilla frutescens var. frutescens]|nr:hypothetical protein C2S51_032459 [Perilla frutescens var. frutescens]